MKGLFEQMPSQRTGINFANRVIDSAGCNIFNFRNFYNGAGVGIGDINNDGLPDILFTSNQGDNVLYLNRGNWQFEDITARAGIKGIHRWHTGVSMADVNGDGWLDIYISNSGDVRGEESANELYINQHDNTFKEQAKEYGLADGGIGTQAVFFDYDGDGDLDCFVLNNSFRPIGSFGYDRHIRNIRSARGGHRLYRNDHHHFVDVSEQAGIYGSEIGFGLGVTVGDLNNDGWPDMYVSNDFFEKDYMYINQHDGTFKEVIDRATGHVSLASMGSDMVDINNDGWLDIFTTDMLPEGDRRLKMTTKFDDYDVNNMKLGNDFHHQLEQNCLQLNNGDGTFSEIADLAGVEATDWSWGALSFDMDDDGWKDIFVCNGIAKDLTNQDFLSYFGNDQTREGVIKGGFNYRDFIDKIPVTPIANYAFHNDGGLHFTDLSGMLGLGALSFSNGAAYGDLDGDGDLDLVVNNENAPAFVYRNMSVEKLHHHYLNIRLRGQAPNTMGVGARVTLYTGSGMQMLEAAPLRGFESCSDPLLHFGLGDGMRLDSVVVRWPDRRVQIVQHLRPDTVLVLSQAMAGALRAAPVERSLPSLFVNVTDSVISGNIRHRENGFVDFHQERLIPKMLSTEGPRLAVADVNGDGLEDFFMGGARGDTAKLFLQRADGHFEPSPQYAFARDMDQEDAGAAFFDADGDGDMDLVVASGSGEAGMADNSYVRLYINDGNGNFTRGFSGWPPVSLNASCVCVGDVDGDGKQDVFIGARSVPMAYGKAPHSVLLRNMGRGRFEDVTGALCPELAVSGMVTAAAIRDMDGDGRNELVVAGDWMPVTIWRWADGRLSQRLVLEGSSGWWNCLTIADLNGDGRPDIVAGNTGLNTKTRADPQHPAKLYTGDINRNGGSECVAVYYKSDGQAYPFNLLGDMVAQMPWLKKRFLYFRDYAGLPVEKVFTREELAATTQLEATQTQSCVFINRGDKGFEMHPLPQRVQFAPVYAALATDLDGDGRQDLFMAGNFFGLKPETGRYDAGYGFTLLGRRGGGYEYLPNIRSGLFIQGEVRDIVSIRTARGPVIVVARNNEALQIFRKNK